MPIVNPPPSDSVDTQDGSGNLAPPKEGWRNFFQQVYTVTAAVVSSGTTVKRPTKLLWIGRTYFDETLNIPIWYDGVDWIDATGAVV